MIKFHWDRIQNFLYEGKIMKFSPDFVMLENLVSSIEEIETVLYDLGDTL